MQHSEQELLDLQYVRLLTEFDYFVRFFFKAQYNKSFMLEPYHAQLFDALVRVARGETRRLIINIPPRYAKAIDSDTPMWTPEGWVRAGDVRVGGSLLGSDGRWTAVLGVYPQGVKPAYKVSFSDGASLVACGEHLWSARLRDKSSDRSWTAPWQIKKTDELAADLFEADGRKKWRIPVLADGNDCDISLPIDPYLFGLWLGDGHSHYAAITTMDKEIIDCFSGFEPKPHKHQSSGRATTYGIRKGFGRALLDLGVLKNKHIPDVYFRSSHRQRLALLQGISDTDGTVNKKNGEQSVSFSSKRLSDDLHFLINSLGGTWRCNESQPECGRRAYKTSISLANGDVAFRLKRKLDLVRGRSERNSPRRFVADISPVESREMVCFSVEAPDHLFCAGRDLVVTHNTEIAVKMFIAWCLANNAAAKFIHLSYSDDLALDNSSAIRDLVKSAEYQKFFPMALRADSDSKKKWFTEARGGLYATAAGGAITGFGAGGMGRRRVGTGSPADGFAGAIIIDDPLKPDDAFSDTMRDRINRRFTNTIASRTNSPETPIIVIMQRLHENDMTGFLLNGGSGEEWEHLCLSAITETGEALWPEKHSIEMLRQMEMADPYTFAGQYMQRPSPLAGGIFKPDNIQIVGAIPAGPIDWVRGWDFASTTTGDWSAGPKLGLLPDGRLIIGDMVRIRVGPDERDAALVNTAARDGDTCRISIPQDPGQAGVTQIKYLVRKLAGYTVKTSPETGSKITRAEPFASQINVGNVMMLKADWNDALISEMRMFPNGTWDDQVDGLSRAFMELIGSSQVEIFIPNIKEGRVLKTINGMPGKTISLETSDTCGGCNYEADLHCTERVCRVKSDDPACDYFARRAS
jgi:predicted phage terminase large subunit-like protein